MATPLACRRSCSILNAAVEVGTHGVHLVDVHHTGNLVLVSLTPNGLRLRLNTTLSGQNGHRTVQNAQRALDLNSEVNVARGVDDVDTMTVLLEETGSCWVSVWHQ